MASRQPSESEIDTALKELHDTPVATPSDGTLSLLTNYLLGSPVSGSSAPLAQKFDHWLCSRSTPTIRETAKFLIRLHAYNSPRVDVWRQQFRKCLSSCCQCVRALQEAKINTRHNYFGAFSDSALQPFYSSFDNWELEGVVEGLEKSQVLSPPSSRKLTDAPPALAFHVFCNLHILQDTRILEVLHARTPTSPISSWPADYPPPGLLHCLLHRDASVREWACTQIAHCTASPMHKNDFLPPYRNALETIASMVLSRADDPATASNAIPYTRDMSAKWSAYNHVLQFVPEAYFRPSAAFGLDLRQIVIGHLHDTSTHFAEVLRCFPLIISRLGSELWEGEGPEYPLLVLNSIKDNSRYLEILQSLVDAPRSNWLLRWVEPFLKTVGRTPGFKDVLSTMVHFLCEELQHERFKGVRPAAMTIAARILIALFVQIEKESPSYDQNLVQEIIDVHGSVFVSVAFAREYTGERWSEPRSTSRKLIRHLLAVDVKAVYSAVISLSHPSKPLVTTTCKVHEQLWKETYDTIQPGDSDAVALVVSTLSAIAHVDELKESAFAERLGHVQYGRAYRSLLSTINRTLKILHAGFSDAISRYLDLSPVSVIVDLLRKKDIVREIMILMLSPIETIQESAQALAGSAFDVEVRPDCLRALLEKHPDAALEGIFRYLETYVQFADGVPEACSLSKALARCLTDIIDVFCSSPDGLLLNQQFLQQEGVGSNVPSRLPQWWNLMTRSLAVIFLKTPKWAVYFDNADMILWMRDALIFGRDMLAQRRVIESGALAHSQQALSNRKLSRVGKKMVDDLQPVLQELTRWLRLTDEELLHQSFSLLESLLACFRQTGVSPDQDALSKLQKYIDSARKRDPLRPQTKLDSARLARLQNTISAFDENDKVEVTPDITPDQREKTAPERREAVDLKGKRPVGVTSRKPSPPEQRLPQIFKRPPPKFSLTSYFSADDKKKLEVNSSVPQFTRKPQAVTAGSVNAYEGGSSNRGTSPTLGSSSEGDNSEADESATLASLSKLQRSPKSKRPTERRQVMMLDAPLKGWNPAAHRRNKREDARRTQMRLKPDISGLHRTLLSWNYDHSGPHPPGDPLRLMPVPDKFTDANHFCRVFEPLLLLECWTQLIESKEDTPQSYDCRVASRQFVDDWVDLDIAINEGVPKDWTLSDADVVLLRHPTNKKSVLGKAQSCKWTHFGLQATIRCLARGSDPGLQVNSTWFLSKVMSLTTLHREFAALMALPYYDLCDTILQAKLTSPSVPDSSEVSRTMSSYKVNEPQAKAILYSLNGQGLTLVQGPPGTGKTSTICGLVHACLLRRPRPTTTIHVGRNSGPADKEPVKKILLCAPSNAAIDEIVSRLKDGVSGAGRQATCPKVVRVGTVNSMNINIRDVSLEHLIEQKINADTDTVNSKDASTEIARLRAELETVKSMRQQKLDEISTIQHNTSKALALEEEIRKSNKQKATLIHQLDKLKDKQRSDSRTMDATRRRFRAEVLQEADVICSTLSGAAYEYLEQFDFELIVIDEAAQAIELSSLIPLKYRCTRCVMVGDPKQLPPTVKSQQACNLGYDQSLFLRLQRQRPDAVHLLSIQYRMHPDISRVPSRLFYMGKLEDGPDVLTKTMRPWHSNSKLGTYRFFNVLSGQEESGSGNSHSFINRAECQIAVALYNRLRRGFAPFDFDFKVGVISMYRGQIIELRRAFGQQFGPEITATVDFNTVDGFQGQEKDVIILSCVRAGPGVQSVGFLKDVRRMNVAITRAKASLFVLGHAPTLGRSDETWREVIADARERAALVDVDITYFTTPLKVAKTKPTPSVAKQPSPQPSTNLSLPSNLATPRELKESRREVRPESSKMANKELVGGLPKDDVGHDKTDQVTTGTKRSAPDGEGNESHQGAETSRGLNGAKPKPPPKKRAKAAPTLFIPKKVRSETCLRRCRY
ncbi:helicase sen1 [Wolfiporia cocos MD-104 SS10]|uniref:Helicase sen1 n=1 Tax=Wolfiporia cocos (strain MD-104) TaxID=742152 RepID=A0A2H3JQU7_WOLCO|nr:helicase sen1 [Wolfiporia cocos MD-104 SS10]